MRTRLLVATRARGGGRRSECAVGSGHHLGLRCYSQGHQTETPVVLNRVRKKEGDHTPRACASKQSSTLGSLVGSRWSQEAKTLCVVIGASTGEVGATSRQVGGWSRRWRLRWYSVSSCAAARAFAASLVTGPEREQHHAGLCG